jgi:hypothetical protein
VAASPLFSISFSVGFVRPCTALVQPKADARKAAQDRNQDARGCMGPSRGTWATGATMRHKAKSLLKPIKQAQEATHLVAKRLDEESLQTSAPASIHVRS